MLRDQLIQAVNGHPISADDAWVLIHRWDEMEEALRRIASGAESNPPSDIAELAARLSDSNWCCWCCGEVAPLRGKDDPWEGRLDGYCEVCATARCDTYPGAHGSTITDLVVGLTGSESTRPTNSNWCNRPQASSRVIPVSAGGPRTEGRLNTSDQARTARLEHNRLTDSYWCIRP